MSNSPRNVPLDADSIARLLKPCALVLARFTHADWSVLREALSSSKLIFGHEGTSETVGQLIERSFADRHKLDGVTLLLILSDTPESATRLIGERKNRRIARHIRELQTEHLSWLRYLVARSGADRYEWSLINTEQVRVQGRTLIRAIVHRRDGAQFFLEISQGSAVRLVSQMIERLAAISDAGLREVEESALQDLTTQTANLQRLLARRTPGPP